MKKTPLALPVLAAATAHAADAAPPKFDPQRLSKDVRILASHAFEGRGPNTAGEKKTVDFLVAQFKAAGLQPGGDLVGGQCVERRQLSLNTNCYSSSHPA